MISAAVGLDAVEKSVLPRSYVNTAARMLQKLEAIPCLPRPRLGWQIRSIVETPPLLSALGEDFFETAQQATY
ncbi:MAG: hypothetical protein FJ196_06155 [Gammaproteobacteria bacterium]|nr:hypothetical protein [Gammaproteobacteria bacterium]